MRAIVVVLMLCISPFIAAAQKVVLYADDAYPPYSFSEQGQARGLYAQILRKAFSRMPDYEVRIEPKPWKRALKALERGEVMAIYPPYWHPQTRPFIWPYSVALFEETVAVHCHFQRSPSGPGARWPEAFQGLRISQTGGYDQGGEHYKHLLEGGHLTEVYARSTELNVLMMAKGRSDCFLNDRLSTRLELKRLQNSVKDDAVLAELMQIRDTATVSQQAVYVGFNQQFAARYPYWQDFFEQLNDRLLEMHGTGEIYQMAKDYVQQQTQCPQCSYLLRQP